MRLSSFPWLSGVLVLCCCNVPQSGAFVRLYPETQRRQVGLSRSTARHLTELVEGVGESVSVGPPSTAFVYLAMDARSLLSTFMNTDGLVFLAGVFPFVWATVEFWRRIAFGKPFGTGSDSIVIIGKDKAPADSRGRRVLGQGALITAYALFGISAFVVVIALYSVLTSTSDPVSLSSVAKEL